MNLSIESLHEVVQVSSNNVVVGNTNQASDLLAELLNDSVLQIVSNAYARYFWYGTAVVTAGVGIVNFITKCLHYNRSGAANPSFFYTRIS